MARRKSSRKEFDGEFDITPMIDVVFLLLTFFMVTARLAPKTVSSLPKAMYGETKGTNESVVINVNAGNPDAIVRRADGTFFSTDKETQAVEIGDYIQYGFEKKGKSSVMIFAEPTVKSREIARLREIISQELEPEQKIMIGVQQ